MNDIHAALEYAPASSKERVVPTKERRRDIVCVGYGRWSTTMPGVHERRVSRFDPLYRAVGI